MARAVSKDMRQRLAQLAQEFSEGDQLIQEARGWLLECFGHDEDAADYIETMTVLGVMIAVERYHVGGWDHFVELAILTK